MNPLPIAAADTTRFFHAWLETFAGYVREVDYASAKPLFHPDVLAFGTHNDVIPSALFPKFVRYRGDPLHELRKAKGTSKVMIPVPLSI